MAARFGDYSSMPKKLATPVLFMFFLSGLRRTRVVANMPRLGKRGSVNFSSSLSVCQGHDGLSKFHSGSYLLESHILTVAMLTKQFLDVAGLVFQNPNFVSRSYCSIFRGKPSMRIPIGHQRHARSRSSGSCDC